MSDDTRIASVTLEPLNVPLANDFAISQGTLSQAANVLVRISLSSGAVGLGEMAPFPDLTGETQHTSLDCGRDVVGLLLEQSVFEYRRLFEVMKEAAPHAPAARCGMEMALLDALTQHLDIPLWAFLGGATRHSQHYTDMTIPVFNQQRTLALARQWYERGFRRLKLKVGVDVDEELRKILAIQGLLPDVDFVLDANGGFDYADAIHFVEQLAKQKIRLALLEQPVASGDLESMARLRSNLRAPLVADESASSPQDVIEICKANAADVINLKIMKSGIRETIQMMLLARSHGLKLMIGGMLETRLAMGCSLALVVGLGGIDYLDLDTPLLLAEDPFRGGYVYDGPLLVTSNAPGLGIVSKSQA
jgi:L-alanine-DL-glutamate epimerase-like enolase superfamily enzyme